MTSKFIISVILPLLLLLSSVPVRGQRVQNFGTSVLSGPTVPASCIQPSLFIRSTTGIVYTCQSGVYVALGGGAAGAVLLSPSGPQTINRQITSVIPNEAEVSNLNLRNTANATNSVGQLLMFNGGGLDVQLADANDCAVYCPGIYWNTNGSIAFWPGGQNVNTLTVTTRTGDTEGLSIFTGAVNAGTATGGTNGVFNALTGYRIANAAAAGHYLRGNATNYVDGTIQAADLPAGVAPVLSGTTGSIGGGVLTAGSCTSGTATVTGATTSMVAVAEPNTYPGDGSTWSAQITAANTVTVRVCAIIGLTPTAGTYKVKVIQ